MGFIDGDQENGLNQVSGSSATGIDLLVSQNPYLICGTGCNGYGTSISKFNGSEMTPQWLSVSTPTYRSPADEFAVFQNRLYILTILHVALQPTTYGSYPIPQVNVTANNTPLNTNSRQAKYAGCSLKVHSDALYAVWSDGTIRISRYNGDKVNPQWALMDGNRFEGLRHGSAAETVAPRLESFNYKLHAFWLEQAQCSWKVRAGGIPPNVILLCHGIYICVS